MRGAIVGLIVAALTACQPTIDIGSNLAVTTGPAGDGGAADDGDGGGTGPASSSGAVGSTGSDGSDDGSPTGAGTTLGAADDDGSTGDAGSSGSSESGQALACEDFFPVDIPCLQCAEDECCDEIELCEGQPECADCFLACIEGGAPPEVCQTGCAPASGTAAIVTCLTLACMVSC